MTGTQPPRGEQRWTPATTSDEDGRPLGILLSPEGARAGDSSAGRRAAVLEHPRARRTPDGDAVLSITFVLARLPDVQDSLEALVDRAIIAFDLETLPSQAALDQLGADLGGVPVALVPLRTTLSLTGGGGRTLASAEMEGPGRRGALQGTLEGSDALAVLGAVQRRPSSLTVQACIYHRLETQPAGSVRMDVDLALVHDRLSAVADGARRFYRRDLQHYLPTLRTARAVRVNPPGSTSNSADWEERMLAAFLRLVAPVLRRVDEPTDPRLGESYELGARPPDGTWLGATVSAGADAGGAGGQAGVEISTTLDRLVAGVPAGAMDRHVNLVAPDGVGGLTQAPRLVRSPARRGAPSIAAAAFVAVEGAVTTQWSAVRAGARIERAPAATAGAVDRAGLVAAPSAHAFLSSGAAFPLAGPSGIWALDDDLIGVAPDASVPSGPLVDDPEGPLWPDRADPGRFWYPPSFALVVPDPALATPSASPFLFRFRAVGHDEQGRPFLEATVQFSLESRVPLTTSEEWERRGRPPLTPVPTGGLSAELRVPYRDEAGTTRVQPVKASRIKKDDGRVVVEVDLLDRWARVCYGALSREGFQEIPARLSVAYTFSGWHTRRPPLVLGHSVLKLPALELVARRGNGGGVFAGRMRVPGGVLELGTLAEGPTPATHVPPEEGRAIQAMPPIGGGLPWRPARPPVPVPPIRPDVVMPPDLGDRLNQVRYWQRTNGHSEQVDVVLPCGPFGALYVEEVDGTPRPVGCQETYQLGQAPRRSFEPLAVEAANEGTRVLRSLTSPGRFVVVPGHFRIGRYEPTEGQRAYRPTIVLVSTIDVSDLANTKCVLIAGLQADMPQRVRHRIEEELRERHHPAPELDYVTELPATVEFDWALPRSDTGWGVQDESLRTWDGFQVALTTDAVGVQALHQILATTGVHGRATFQLDDGQRFDSSLDLELDRIVGPWSSGPVESSLMGTTATVVNRIESPVVVTDVLASTGDARTVVAVVAVDAAVAPGATMEIGVPAGTTRVLPLAEAQPTATSLEEVRAYVEDIKFEVRFLNLVNLDAHGLGGLDVTARMVDDPREVRGQIRSNAPEFTVEFVEPLTRFAAGRSIEFRVERLGLGGVAVGATGWLPWRLDVQGHVISLTPGLIA